MRSLWDRPAATELNVVRAHLPESLWPLFERMSPSDQAHSIRVFQALIKMGHTDLDLLTAALLHDVGKCLDKPNVFERVMVVLANRIAPGRVLTWSEGRAKGWKRAFVIAHQHPEWGADLVAQHGGTDATVQLIRHHQRPASDTGNDDFSRRLSLLQAADSEN